MSAAYAIYHGPDGIQTIAERVSQLAKNFADKLKQSGYEIYSDHFFDTVTIVTKDKTDQIYKNALDQKVNIRRVNSEMLAVSFDEKKNVYRVNQLLKIFNAAESIKKEDPTVSLPNLPKNLLRTSKYLEHPVFNSYHSETEMLRYLKKLEDKDIALNRTMIALGSCTMKLNATAEMIPISWRELAEPHPFVPIEQMEGYRDLFTDLRNWLRSITGFSGVSLQPNAGAQGEYAGLMVIRKYHLDRGEENRNICLIPSSAHGTNPASAQMVGMKVVVVDCDKEGNVDFEDLKKKAEMHSENLGALMVTYPSTHGVFEEKITDICELIHKHGGQVYMDGANLNALVGIARPGNFGPDVCHINLHKTFCIPHGGGGPGMGPIGVKKHLKPHLPNNLQSKGSIGPVSAAPFGSPSLLPISWAYCLMMGGDGLTQATRVAILNANYIAKRLQGNFDVLYKGEFDRVAHECILDVRPFSDTADISVEDIAKRLIDCGFHAPTMSWPVAGTLMVEPTESETKAELDRFCDAMLAIREEIRQIEENKMDRENNPLKNAPHTVEDLVGDWNRPYSRDQGCFPPGAFRVDKYWPPVNRVDNAHGDRNLVCICPPMSNYAEAAE